MFFEVFVVDGVSHSWCAQHISQVSPQCGVIHDALLVALQAAGWTSPMFTQGEIDSSPRMTRAASAELCETHNLVRLFSKQEIIAILMATISSITRQLSCMSVLRLNFDRSLVRCFPAAVSIFILKLFTPQQNTGVIA